MCAAIGAVTRGTGGCGPKSEKLFEHPAGFTDQNALLLRLNKMWIRPRIGIFMSDPGHAPVDVWCLGLPENAQQVGVLTVFRQDGLDCRDTKVSQAMQRGE